MQRRLALVLPLALAIGAVGVSRAPARALEHPTLADSTRKRVQAPRTPSADTVTPRLARPARRDPSLPNEMGRIPIFEYHLIGDRNSTYERTVDGFRRDLEVLYARGYRAVSIKDLVDRKLDLPAGQSPVVLVFDDASPSQFRYLEQNGKLEVDPTSVVGILLDFHRKHPDWGNKAVFCLLPAADAGHAFFGNKGIEGQKTEWRFPKIRFLAEQGFELCNHTLWHANLKKYPDAFVQEQIARGQMAIDSAVPGYVVRTLALPLGMWPKRRELAHTGSWHDPRKGGRDVTYDYAAVLEVAGGPARSPYDPAFNPRSLPRVQVIGDSALVRTLDHLERAGERYVSDGNPKTIAKR